MMGSLEMLLAALLLSFSYSVAFFGSFFLSILSFILYTSSFFWVAVQSNSTMLGLFVVIMYLSGMMVLFSYAFMLKDIKVSFVVNALNAVLVLVFLLALQSEGVALTTSLDLMEVYDAGASVLSYSAVLLYSVLSVCLSLCLGAKVF